VSQDLDELFCEGVEYTVKEGWVAPEQIEDLGLRAQYAEVVATWEKFQQRARDFQTAIDEREDT
jgi:hypothetical protein